MAMTKDIQKYVTLAQSLSIDPSLVHETGENSSLKQMEALLASNCQKLCVGPSFHFYTSEDMQNIPEQFKEMRTNETSSEISSDEEYDTVIYKGPDVPFEIVKHKKSDEQNLVLKDMKVKLAQASAEYGGLLSPSFFLQSPGVLSSTDHSERNNELSTLPSESAKINISEYSQSHQKTAFMFPNSSERRENIPLISTDSIAPRFERVEILDDNPNANEHQWVEWPKKFIESKGFCLGVQPGDFYKHESRPCFYVKLPHLSSYEVLVTNNNQIPCDLDLFVDGKLSNALRMPPGASVSIDGPQYSKHAFKVFRSNDVPHDKQVAEGHRENGLIKAVFTPCKVRDARLRAVSDPLRNGTAQNDILDMLEDVTRSMKKRAFTVDVSHRDQDSVERSLNLSRVTEAVTLLQGTKKKRDFVVAPEMETDLTKQIVLQLRLIASLDEEDTAEKEEIYDLEPPPLPIKKN